MDQLSLLVSLPAPSSAFPRPSPLPAASSLSPLPDRQAIGPSGPRTHTIVGPKDPPDPPGWGTDPHHHPRPKSDSGHL